MLARRAHSSHPAVLVMALALLAPLALGACAVPDPPTVTPGPVSEGGIEGPVPGGRTVIEVTMEPPPRAQPMPVVVDELGPYADEGGRFSLMLPEGWMENRQPAGDGSSDVVLGTVFQAPDGDGILTVTHFDNGQEPSGLGTTANTVLRDVTGWMSQPGYRELARESVLERPGEAMRIEIQYERSNGVLMHSLVLFQIDGTNFSMVNASVEDSSWSSNEGALREILSSYRVPASRDMMVPDAEDAAEGGPEDAGGAAGTDGEATGDASVDTSGSASESGENEVPEEGGEDAGGTGEDAP